MTGTAAGMQIEENLALAARRGLRRTLRPGIRKSEREEYRQRLQELGLGLDTRLSAKVGTLSGGQRQRLTIARALVRKPEILIMDDSASALDFATDARLRKAIREETRDMTVFLVSQRVATVRGADQIIVLDDGKIAGMGTHRQLLDGCQIYREICQSQLSEKEVH